LRLNDPNNYQKSGSIYQRMGQYDLSIADYTNYSEIDPDNAYTYYARGIAYYNQKKYDPALADFNRSIELDPNLPNTYYGRGRVHMVKGEYQLAIDDFSKAIAVMPVNLVTGRNAVCPPSNTEDISLYPCRRSFYIWRGVAYRKISQYDKAIADFTSAIEMEPQNAWSYYNRGSTYFNKADYPRAAADFDKAAELDPTMLDAVKARDATGRVIFELH